VLKREDVGTMKCKSFIGIEAVIGAVYTYYKTEAVFKQAISHIIELSGADVRF